ncbi:hypothetical protein D3C71_1938120 [compost metagenome]
MAVGTGKPYDRRGDPARVPRFDLLGAAFADALGHAGLRVRIDCVDRDAVAPQFARRDDGHRSDARLGRAIVDLADVPIQPR